MNTIRPIVLTLLFTLSLCAKEEQAYTRFVGTSGFILLNLIPNQKNPPNFFQLNGGIKLTPKDVLSLEAITWKFNTPIGIAKSGNTKEQYPGYVREFGLGAAYQRYFWRGAYSAVHILPLLTRYSENNSPKTINGFKLFCTFRAGYHFELCRNRLFIEPSFAMTYWPVNTNRPDSFKREDTKCTNVAFEPGLHLGFQF